MQEPTPVAHGPAETRRPYTAVIYVHGIGSQRRYEESARLIDRLDQFLGAQTDISGGILRKIKPKVEVNRAQPNGKPVTYIGASLTPKDPGAALGDVRFYECYWAPLMAGEKSALGVLQWIALQALRPFKTLRAPWNEMHRLRRAALADLCERDPAAAGAEPQDWEDLLQIYDRFDKLEVQQGPEAGGFEAFLAFIPVAMSRPGQSADPATVARLSSLACAWRAHYRRTEWQNGMVLITMLLALLLAGLALLWLVHWGLAALGAFSQALGADSPLGQALASYLKPGWAQALTVAGFVVTAWFGWFLTDYLGDVEVWTTYEETNEKNKARAAVIEACTGLMQHVLADGVVDGLGNANPQGRCERVVVIAHSLGTSVAHDALLELRKCNKVAGHSEEMIGAFYLKLISHFITMGSPIDKINYFFETVRSKSHRYLRVVEELRGDIGTAPFSLNAGVHAKPWVHWINFWDQADVISGPLASPTGRKSLANQVDNVHVPRLAFPNPGAAHLAYFGNVRVLRIIAAVIFHNDYAFAALPVLAGKGRDYRAAWQGPGLPRGRYRLWFCLALILPWLAGFAAVAAGFGAARPALWALGGLAFGISVLVLGWLLAKLIPPADAIEP